jgi:hypothetical protein
MEIWDGDAVFSHLIKEGLLDLRCYLSTKKVPGRRNTKGKGPEIRVLLNC